jgi:hypothetical protein
MAFDSVAPEVLQPHGLARSHIPSDPEFGFHRAPEMRE